MQQDVEIGLGNTIFTSGLMISPSVSKTIKRAHTRTHARTHAHMCEHACTCVYMKLHEAEPLMRSRQLCSYLRTSLHFMDPECSLPYSQKPSLVLILSQMNLFHTNPFYVSKIHFNIIHPPMSWSF
jgi:hypothetical protein